MAVATVNSTNNVFTAFTGTEQEVINAMDAAGINTLKNTVACVNTSGSKITVIVEKRG